MSIRGGVLTRGTTNGNSRGSAEDRRRRRAYLVERDGWPAVGIVLCYLCGVPLLQDEDPEAPGQSVTVDRIVPGCEGGRYTRDNIRAACGGCNSETGGALSRRPTHGPGALTIARTVPPGESSPPEHSRHVTRNRITPGQSTPGSTHASHGAGALTFAPPSIKGGNTCPGL